jgi:hypothetical protein
MFDSGTTKVPHLFGANANKFCSRRFPENARKIYRPEKLRINSTVEGTA